MDSEALERDFSLIDRLLIEELRACVLPEVALEWEKEAKKELKVYKKDCRRKRTKNLRQFHGRQAP